MDEFDEFDDNVNDEILAQLDAIEAKHTNASRKPMTSLRIPRWTPCSFMIFLLAILLRCIPMYQTLLPMVRSPQQAARLAWCNRVSGVRLSSPVMTVESLRRNIPLQSKPRKARFRLHHRMALAFHPIKFGTIVHFYCRTELNLCKKTPRTSKTP